MKTNKVISQQLPARSGPQSAAAAAARTRCSVAMEAQQVQRPLPDS
jgi:hypothetical protein